jgi:hypothetical protein
MGPSGLVLGENIKKRGKEPQNGFGGRGLIRATNSMSSSEIRFVCIAMNQSIDYCERETRFDVKFGTVTKTVIAINLVSFKHATI